MKRMNVLLRNIPFTPEHDAPWTGVDAGVKGLLESGFKVEKAYGDFDSVTAEDIELFRKNLALDIVPSAKNYTDSELALLSLSKLGYTAIDVYGALGGRKDHELMNIQLLAHDELRNLDIRLLNDTNEITLLTAGDHVIAPDNKKKYISFIPVHDKTLVTLNGFKYDIQDTYLHIGRTLTVSNEFKEPSAAVKTDKDILMIKSTD
ncbi:thiamine pyrophosphokinase [Jeotgalicoccus coquinae]|uniref:Thiamine diphosphokinase n=1 Tax=Jeotgalicoccus coquinae TaxID=709509 RepID=A0A6V7RKR6_9STAP|nr:thiamine diphosphokinase [Jeotgalicoccus coquinae]MBB6422568.1 thiamine pyrophosphokinase [Jeotgalicoccus coquinae]GGE14847.1 thiamine pyrophosphokinase [Jeotgalicoccus coquinae]CAD2078040.1 Thiamine pyrophosphokinase [Jeotgalicoccus coquinae]